MANSRYEYVRTFEKSDVCMPNTFIVVRIDGRGFTKLTTKYEFEKPSDRRALDLMNVAAQAVMKDLPDLVLAYGQSDEFSFVFHKDCQLFERRESKLITTIVSTFTANYVFAWAKYFPTTPLTPPLPSFDGRAVCYPTENNLRDYLSWRQADCHINNLFNTTFWALVKQGGLDPRDAEQRLSGTLSADKNEILFSGFGINYNNEPDIFRKGSVLYRDFSPTSSEPSPKATIRAKSPPPLSHPEPKRTLVRPMSQPLERTKPSSLRDSPLSGSSDPMALRGPTFLSTSTTPSPPLSPQSMSIPTFPSAMSNDIPLVYPHSRTNGSITRQSFPMLTPIPLPPPTLKPSTRPPPSLNPPNPTAHTNFSPLPSPNPSALDQNSIPAHPNSTPKRTKKPNTHSASASLSRPVTATASSSKPTPKRSPSMSILNFGPPQIPLRISSIPMNAAPRKLSLPNQTSYSMLKAEEKEDAGVISLILGRESDREGGSRTSPRSPPSHLKTMKELPSPPAVDNWTTYTRESVMGSAPQQWSASPTGESARTGIDAEMGHVEPGNGNIEGMIVNPVIPVSPPARSTHRTCSHSRLHSAPPTSLPYFSTSTSAFPSPTNVDGQHNKSGFAHFDWADPVAHSWGLQSLQPSKPNRKEKSKAKEKTTNQMEEAGGWAAKTQGRPVQMSKTQRDKDRKKRTKAKVVIEYVDLIKDGFWEKRPWILSGRAG